MPRYTPVVKVEQTEGHGATVVLVGDNFDEAYARARELEQERGLTFVHPIDDPAIISGAGTSAMETLEDVPVPDTLVVPLAGGALLADLAIPAQTVNPDLDFGHPA